jgi:hypothetical protein
MVPASFCRRHQIGLVRTTGPLTARPHGAIWRAPMREPELEKVPVGLPLPDITFDQFMELEDGWSTREERV